MYMVFFIRGGNVSRSDPKESYSDALDTARRGPSGANFTISFFSDNPAGDRIVLEGFVS